MATWFSTTKDRPQVRTWGGVGAVTGTVGDQDGKAAQASKTLRIALKRTIDSPERRSRDAPFECPGEDD
jgi:hypothetical protein